jgi:hemerythrin-like domain-containing protein
MNTGAYDVLSEHQHIRRMVDTLEAAIEKRSLGGYEWLDDARPVLLELAAGLSSHFRGEEAELFGDVTRRLPRHAPTIERLTEQHRRLAQDFGKSATDVTTLDATHSEAVESFLSLLSKSLRLLRAHEEQENELMLVAYWQDLGETSD